MNFKKTMSELKAMGTAQNRKVYQRHGSGANLFGVSFANLKTLKKKIKTDHELASQLWETENTDAQSLALMIADPHVMTSSQLDQWLRGVDYSLLAGMLGGLAAKTKHASKKLSKWTGSKKEFTRCAGYDLLAAALRDDPDSIADETCADFLETIESTIHSSANYARQAMNGALIAIGGYKPSLRASAVAAARRIGPVEVDHGETSCKTPDAEAYIGKMADRERTRTTKKTASKRKVASRAKPKRATAKPAKKAKRRPAKSTR